MRRLIILPLFVCLCALANAQSDYNSLIVQSIQEMPRAGVYAKYQKSRPGKQFNDLYQTVVDLNAACQAGGLAGKKLKIDPAKAANYSFCSSATYLLLLEVLEKLQNKDQIKIVPSVVKELAEVGDQYQVIQGKMDGIGLFGHWNADGPGTAVLFERLKLGTNFSSFEKAKAGDFLKIFWNENIGKGESGHLVVYLAKSKDGKQIQVWSSNLRNTNGSGGYGTMWIERSRIKRALFSRLTTPQNINNWANFSGAQKSSEYLIRIRKTGSSGSEMKQVTGAID